MKNRLTALLLATAIVCSLAACGIVDLTPTPSGTEDPKIDVIVVGAGGAGLTAGIAAARGGKKVLLLEKTDAVGGNTLLARGGMNAAGTSWQSDNGWLEEESMEVALSGAVKAYPELSSLADQVRADYDRWTLEGAKGYFDCPALFALDALWEGQGINDPQLVTALAENSAGAIDWLDSFGASLHAVVASSGSSVRRCHRPVDREGKLTDVGTYLVPLLHQFCIDNGVEILCDTAATGLLVNDGQVVGVRAGDRLFYADAVILCTGGFGADLERITGLAPQLEGCVTMSADSAAGDGLQMAQDVGAAVRDLDAIQLQPLVEKSSFLPLPQSFLTAGAILVNSQGLRFCDESAPSQALSEAQLAQEGENIWLIFDQRVAQAVDLPQDPVLRELTLLSAQSYEGLARAMGVPQETLKDTLEEWNSFMVYGRDQTFGRLCFAGGLDTAPYYAVAVAPGVCHTLGGLQINAAAQVLTEEGIPIPGLYAAGEVTGGIHGAHSPEGNGLTDLVVFGRIAGESAAAGVE